MQSADAVGMRYGFTFFLACIQRFASCEDAFYEGFLLPHLLPLAFLCPARPEFLLTDPQFLLALHEAASCVYAINTSRVSFWLCNVFFLVAENFGIMQIWLSWWTFESNSPNASAPVLVVIVAFGAMHISCISILLFIVYK